MVRKKITVVSGFPTSGKTTVGRVLEEGFGLAVADLDQLIEEEAGKAIKNLIREEGEEAFRACESKALGNALTAGKVDVLTVGGGLLLSAGNRDLVSKHLHLSLDVLPEIAASRSFVDEKEAIRKGSFPKRPLLATHGKEELSLEGLQAQAKKLRGEREHLFYSADVRINTSWAAPEDVAKLVFEVINSRLDSAKGSLLIPIRLREESGFELIVVGCGLLNAEPELEKAVGLAPVSKALIVDQAVLKLWREDIVSGSDAKRFVIEIPSGEQSKNLSEVSRICEELAKCGVRRGDQIVAIGGGVVGDIAGLVSTLYMRGIDLVQIPTTVVAQVDSSIGGKTGVNLESGKNLVGTFEPAKLILSDIGLLSTLPEREYRSGLAEVIKYGLIRSGEFFDWVEKSEAAIVARDKDTLQRMVELSTLFKLDFVHGDIRDTSGQRAQLNFGHTVGHAIEKLGGYNKLLHGEAVSIGMVVACRLGESLGITPQEIQPRLKSLLVRFGLPVSVPEELISEGLGAEAKKLADTEVGKRWVDVLQLDKKRTKDSANFVLLTEFGAAACFDVELEAILRVVFSR